MKSDQIQINSHFKKILGMDDQVKSSIMKHTNKLNYDINEIRGQQNVDFIDTKTYIDNMLNVSNSNLILFGAKESTLEELILLSKRAIEKKSSSFDEILNQVRNSARELFKLRYCVEKELKKSKFF